MTESGGWGSWRRGQGAPPRQLGWVAGALHSLAFNTVDFVESQQSRPCGFGPVHWQWQQSRPREAVEFTLLPKTGNKVERCRFVAGFGIT